jgi:hypothetical protein
LWVEKDNEELMRGSDETIFKISLIC